MLYKTFRQNRVILLWFSILLLILYFKEGVPGTEESLFQGIFSYWAGHWDFLFKALWNTLSLSLPVAVILLLLSFLLALVTAYHPKIALCLSVLVILGSLLPSVYFIHLVRIISPGGASHSRLFAGFVLVFSNLILYFFFLGFKKEISKEFDRDYHFLTWQLGVKSRLVSARQKLLLTAAEGFLPLFIMVFSSTIFVESKLNIDSGIYTFLYNTIKSTEHRPDIFWGQLLFIFVFVALLQMAYGFALNVVKTRYY